MTVLDSFDRANGSLGTSDSGQTWSVLTGTATITSNAATPTSGSPSATAALPFGNHDNGDFSLRIKVSSLAANPAGLVFRILDNNNRVGCFLAASTQKAQIFKTDGGTTTMLAEAAATIAINTFYTVRAVLTGAKVDMYVDGVFAVTFTLTGGDETQYTNANGYTKVGFRGDTTATFDDLISNTTQTITATGIASGEAFGTTSVVQTVAPTGIVSQESFGAATVAVGDPNQTITPTGIASAQAFGNTSLGGPIIFPVSIPSAEAFGATRLVQYPSRVQSRWIFIPKDTFNINVPFDVQAATAGNALVFVGAFHHDIGTITLNGTGWNYPVNLRAASGSLVVAWKVAAGGEAGITGTFTQGNDTGSNAVAIEYASSAPGMWSQFGTASHNTDGTNVKVWSSGTTPASIGDGVSVAGFGLNGLGPDSTDSFSNSYATIFAQGGGEFESGVWAADKLAPYAATQETTLTRSGTSAVANKTSGGVVIIGKAAVQVIAPSPANLGEVFGQPDLPVPPQPPSIPSAEAFGTPTLAFAPFNIQPAGLASAESFGIPVLSRGPVLQVIGIASAQAFGTPTVEYGKRLTFIGGVNPAAVYMGGVQVKLYQGGAFVWQ